jgi:hypothetical protein
MKTYTGLSLAIVAALALGCEMPNLEPPRQTASVQTPAAENPASDESYGQRPGELFGKEDWYLPDGRVDMSGVEGEPPMTNGTPREVLPRDPKQGKLTRKRGGALGADLQALPWAKNKVTFDMIKYNLQIFEADKSRWPKSHKEFMEVFLPQYYPAALPLPKLEPGDAYLYDPEDHLLKIFRPGDPGAPQVEGVVAYEAEPEDAEAQ